MSTFLCFFLSLLFFSGSFERLNITSKFRRVGPSCLHFTELGIFTCAHTHTHTLTCTHKCTDLQSPLLSAHYIYTRAHTHTHTHTHTHRHTDTHRHTQTH